MSYMSNRNLQFLNLPLVTIYSANAFMLIALPD